MGFRLRKDKRDKRTPAQKQVDAYRVKNTVSVHFVLETLLQGGTTIYKSRAGSPTLRKVEELDKTLCAIPIDLFRMLRRSKYILRLYTRKIGDVPVSFYGINPDESGLVWDAIKTSKENEKRVGMKPTEN